MLFDRVYSASVRWLPGLLSILGFVGFWELYVAISGISPQVLPPPSRVAGQIIDNWPLIWANTIPTLRATLLGFACSVSAAFLISLLIEFVPSLRRAVFPILVVSQTLPLVAIAPLVVLWFGFGLLPKILLVALVTFFPMLVALVDGYHSTDREIEALLKSMGAGRYAIFRRVRFPSALSHFFAGLRISVTYAVVAAIFAEYAGARAGLGILILNAKNSFRPDLVLAAVVVSSMLTLCLFCLVTLIQQFCMKWRTAGAQT